MGNIEQLLEPEGRTKFFKYNRLFEKQWKKSQTLMLYITYGNFSLFIANVRLTHACYIALSSLDLVVEK